MFITNKRASINHSGCLCSRLDQKYAEKCSIFFAIRLEEEYNETCHRQTQGMRNSSMIRHKAEQEIVQGLVQRFRENYHEYTRTHSDYNETLLRIDFLNPFLAALGWDVENKKQAPQHLREVVHEDTVQVDDTDEKSLNKKPDYAFRVGHERKFFLEAKKPSVAIATNDRAAFQVRRYGWSAQMPISILFSLSMKILENETVASIKAYLDSYKIGALPPLTDNIQWGNSLVDSTYEQFDEDISIQAEKFARLNLFDWDQAFPKIMAEGGFDLIIGNPPYIRIQNMVKYSPDEVQYYKSNLSPYTTAKSNNFDKYFLFLEKGLNLLKQSGILGYIVPNKFFKTKAGKTLRRLIASNKYLSEIVDFGVQQVFAGQTITYTCILILKKEGSSEVGIELVTDLQRWRHGQVQQSFSYNADRFSELPWRLLPPELDAFFTRLESANPLRLANAYDIFVGLQTSNDEIYIFFPEHVDEN
jgi:hypothetical protein